MRISDWSSDVCSSDLERELIFPVGLGTRRKALQIRKHGIAVLARDAAIRGIRHGRVQRMVGRQAVMQRPVKIGRRPFAYSMLLVGGDVGSINTAERRVERYAAGKRRAISGGMAGGAVGGAHQVLAARQQLDRKSTRLNSSH